MSDDAPPLKAQDRDGMATYRQLAKFVKGVRRDQGRLNTLRLWEPAVGPDGVHVKEIATVTWNDHPAIQTILERRDRYNELRERIEKLQRLLDDKDVPAEARVDGYRTYDSLQRRLSDELKSIEETLMDLRREFAGSAKTLATILVEGSKIRLHTKVHQDRMDLAKGQDPSQLSSADLLKLTDPEL